MNLIDVFPQDGGPIYRETYTYLQNPEHSLLVEPWNAISSLFFIAGAIWIFSFLHRKKIYFPLLQYGIVPLLLLGGIGSTLYHAFRATRWFMWLDVFPMFMLTLLISFYCWQKVTKNTVAALSILSSFILFRFLVFYLNLPMQTAINLSYLIVGIAMGLPIFLTWIQIRFAFSFYIFSSLVSISLAFFFRWYDDVFSGWSMGVHWLWHIFSVMAAIFASLYLIQLKVHFDEYSRK